MSKNKKKRNKIYKGAGSANVQPTIIKVSAVNRSKISQWWFDNKAKLKPILIILAIILVIIFIISGIIGAINR